MKSNINNDVDKVENFNLFVKGHLIISTKINLLLEIYNEIYIVQ